MNYITKVDDYHVIELNGVNVKVREASTYFIFKNIDVCKANLNIRIPSYTPLSTIVVFVEMVRLIKEQTNGNA